MTIRKQLHKLSLPLALALATSTGCAASFTLKETPPGFIEVSSSQWGGDGELRMKAPDNVGINITTIPKVMFKKTVQVLPEGSETQGILENSDMLKTVGTRV